LRSLIDLIETVKLRQFLEWEALQHRHNGSIPPCPGIFLNRHTSLVAVGFEFIEASGEPGP
jgi:hypothetical protein